MKNNNFPIGVFDSGVGGLTVLNQLCLALPNEQFVYFGDTAHVPYGNKSQETIEKYCVNIVKFLKKQKVKLIVVACNTASAIALSKLQKITKTPILNVIDPCVKVAIETTKNNYIGVIGTKTTISSMSYVKKIKKINKEITVYSKECPLFVPIIEEALSNHSIANLTAQLYLNEIPKQTDTLILGCTHYPLIKDTIQKNISSRIKILDSSIIVADYIKKYLNNFSMQNSTVLNKKNKFYISDDINKFEKAIVKIMQPLDYIIEKVET